MQSTLVPKCWNKNYKSQVSNLLLFFLFPFFCLLTTRSNPLINSIPDLNTLPSKDIKNSSIKHINQIFYIREENIKDFFYIKMILDIETILNWF